MNYGGGPHQQLLGPAMSVGTAPATTGGLNSFGIWSVEDRKKAWQDKQEKEKKEEKEEKEERKKDWISDLSLIILRSCTFILITVFPLCMICIDLSDSEDSSQTFVEIGKGVTHHLKFKHPKCVPYISTPH